MTPDISQRIARLNATLARSKDATAAEDVAALSAEIQRLEAEVVAFEHAFNSTSLDRDQLLAHLGGRRPWADSSEAPVSTALSLSRMLDDLKGSASLSLEELTALGRRLEAGEAKTMSAADWRAMSLISEKLIAEDGSMSGEAFLAQANNASRLINFWKSVFGSENAIDEITLTELLRQKLNLLTLCAQHGYQAQCLPQIEALLLNLGLGDRYMDETGTARRAMQDHARQTGLAPTGIEVIDLAAHNRSIGILALLDYYLRAQKIGLLPANKIILLCDKFLENEYLVELLRNETIVIEDADAARPLRALADSLSCHFAATLEVNGREMFWAEAMAETYAAWTEPMGGSLLQLSDSDLQQGYATLQDVGISPTDRFVCVHVRQAGYKPEFAIDSPNNCAIETYFDAMKDLVDAGYRVIRLGNQTMTRLPEIPGVIDYAHSHLRSAFMDVFLIANCAFYIGTASGPSILAFAFERPAVMTNIQPLIARPPREHDIFIPKLYRRSASGNLLKFGEILASPLGYVFNNSSLFMDEKIEVVDNSAEEIRHAVREMVEFVTARPPAQGVQAPVKSPLQRRFDAIPTSRLNYGRRGRISQAFVERHAGLLDEAARIPKS
jgi:putative glycosyltransferase (TIGR04372 family)